MFIGTRLVRIDLAYYKPYYSSDNNCACDIAPYSGTPPHFGHHDHEPIFIYQRIQSTGRYKKKGGIIVSFLNAAGEFELLVSFDYPVSSGNLIDCRSTYQPVDYCCYPVNYRSGLGRSRIVLVLGATSGTAANSNITAAIVRLIVIVLVEIILQQT
jgi:hypothetical protein